MGREQERLGPKIHILTLLTLLENICIDEQSTEILGLSLWQSHALGTRTEGKKQEDKVSRQARVSGGDFAQVWGHESTVLKAADQKERTEESSTGFWIN